MRGLRIRGEATSAASVNTSTLNVVVGGFVALLQAVVRAIPASEAYSSWHHRSSAISNRHVPSVYHHKKSPLSHRIFHNHPHPLAMDSPLITATIQASILTAVSNFLAQSIRSYSNDVPTPQPRCQLPR